MWNSHEWIGRRLGAGPGLCCRDATPPGRLPLRRL